MQSKPIKKTHFHSLGELQASVGSVIGISGWMTISQERINDFARVTEDMQWIHIDIEKAKRESPYGSTIAHGYLITSLIPKLMAETISFSNAKMGVNYGSDKVRFTNAVKAGQEIRAVISLMEVQEIEGGYKYKSGIEVQIKGEDKPACYAELIALILA